MSRLSSKLRSADGGRLIIFFCPGCRKVHGIAVGQGPGPRWDWDGNADRPTFSPSILVRAIFPPPREPDDPPDVICHSFVRAGRIEFLSDCTHALAGQTVDLPDHWPAEDAS